MTASWVARWELDAVRGAVVTIDVVRAFTTAAYAFGAGAREIYLVGTVEEALAFKAQHPGSLAMGEAGGLRPLGFELSNSPVQAARADLSGKTLVQRTSAGTQGVLAARHAARQWCASLVCASATARALRASGLGAPTYVITGRHRDAPAAYGQEDEAAAIAIEAERLGQHYDRAAVIRQVYASPDVASTLQLGAEHVHPDDIAYATRIDAFDFCMPVTSTPEGLRITAVHPD